MKKWILISTYIIGMVLPCIVLSHFAPLSSSDYEDPEMNVGWVAVVGFLAAIFFWYLFSMMAKGRLRDFAVSPYYLSWTIVVFVAAGYYSFADDETIKFSILLSRAAFVLLVISLTFLSFELFFPEKVNKIANWMNKVMSK